MRVLLDDHPLETDAESIGDAIAVAAAAVDADGRVIVEVTVDGVPWTTGQFDDDGLRGGRAGEVVLVSANLKELVRGTLDDASTALLDADALQREAAELLQSGDQAEAMKRLGAAIEIWGSVREAVATSADATAIDLGTIKLSDGTAEQALDRLSERLRSLRDAITAHDPVEAADTLLYDLPDVVTEWREMLDVMIRHMERGN